MDDMDDYVNNVNPIDSVSDDDNSVIISVNDIYDDDGGRTNVKAGINTSEDLLNISYYKKIGEGKEDLKTINDLDTVMNSVNFFVFSNDLV